MQFRLHLWLHSSTRLIRQSRQLRSLHYPERQFSARLNVTRVTDRHIRSTAAVGIWFPISFQICCFTIWAGCPMEFRRAARPPTNFGRRLCGVFSSDSDCFTTEEPRLS